jgi:hypothetical protein
MARPRQRRKGPDGARQRRQEDRVNRARLAAVIAAAAVAAGGAGTAVALAAGGSPARSSPATGTSPAAGASGSSYSYYQSMMRRLYGGNSMMGGTSSRYGWMMGETGYRWMMGGTAAPAWMRGSAVPAFMTGMMGTSHDPGKIMGRLWANAPGARVTPAQAARLGNQVPSGAAVDRAANGITFSGTAVRLAVLASPAGGRNEPSASPA